MASSWKSHAHFSWSHFTRQNGLSPQTNPPGVYGRSLFWNFVVVFGTTKSPKKPQKPKYLYYLHINLCFFSIPATRERLLMGMGLVGRTGSKFVPVFSAVFIIIVAAVIVSVIITKTRTKAKRARIIKQQQQTSLDTIR